ncbi:hypothetical protein AWB68_08847 [Caballeronia choica]|uniref:Uncharacterized protein n=1 Tax=Caballeronia choica TaxID=326476 RepID=A0A158L6Q2_9BURK|nr:hypothetical protein AWB68_08847 [Caballeronia choica]
MQFLDEPIHREFAQVVGDELRRREPQDLTAQLRADRTARARHHHDAAMQQLLDVRHVDLHGLAAEQVFEIDLAHAGQERLTLRERREGRQHHRLDAGAHAQRGDTPLHVHRRRRNRDDRVVGFQLFGPERQFADRAEHLVTEDFTAALGGIVVQQPDEAPLARAGQFTHEARASVARAEQDHGLALADKAAVQVELFRRTIECARTAHRQEEQQRLDDQHRARNDGRRLRHRRADHHDQRAGPHRFRNAH